MTEVEINRRFILVSLLAAAVAGGLLRLVTLGDQSLWYDEAFTLNIVNQPGIMDIWHRVQETESTPPLYYIITWAWVKTIGSSGDAGLRLTSAMFGVATIPVSYYTFRGLVGERVALAASWIVAVSPLSIQYSQNARSYTLFTLLALLTVWALLKLLDERGKKYWLIWAISSILLIWTHYFGAFLLIAEFIILAWMLPHQRLKLMTCSILVVLAWLPLVNIFIEQSASDRAAVIETRSLATRFVNTARVFSIGKVVPIRVLGIAAKALLTAGLLTGILLGFRRKMATVLIVLTAFTLFLPVALSLFDIYDRFSVQNVLFTLPMIAAIAAIGLVRLKGIPLLLYLAACVVTIAVVQSSWRYQNNDWRGAMTVLKQISHDGPVVVYPGFEKITANVYLRGKSAKGPVKTSVLWTVIGSIRNEMPELVINSESPPAGYPGSPFKLKKERQYHGFKIIEYRSSRPVSIDREWLSKFQESGQPPALLEF